MRLEKEQEKVTTNALLERKALMRGMVALQEHNRRLEDSSTTLDKDLFKDVLIMQDTIKECKKAMQKGDGHVIAQVHPYEPIVKDKVILNNVKPIAKVIDKGKKKVVAIQINELVITTKNTLVMSKLDLELEKARQEKEDLAKELEKVENEAIAEEM